MPSNKREPICRWVSCGIMVVSKSELSAGQENLAGNSLAEMPKSPRFSPSLIRVIEVLTFPAVQLLDVTGPVQVFASANDLVANAGGAPPYRVKLVTPGGQGVVSSAGVTLAAGPLSHRSA